MTRKYSEDADETVQAHLDALLNAVGDPHAYQQAMTALGQDLGKVLASRLPSHQPVVVICTVEDADYLASGVLEQLAQAGFQDIALACFWNNRRTIGSHKVAEIIQRYVEPLPQRSGVVVVLKSIISGGCVVRTNLLEIVSRTETAPENIFITAPVMYAGAPSALAPEFPEGWVDRFQYVYFAQDTTRDDDGTIRPGIGGSVYELLGWSGQADKNRYFPRLVDARNARFLTPQEASP